MTETLASMIAAARSAKEFEVLGGGLAASDEAGLPVERDPEPVQEPTS